MLRGMPIVLPKQIWDWNRHDPADSPGRGFGARWRHIRAARQGSRAGRFPPFPRARRDRDRRPEPLGRTVPGPHRHRAGSTPGGQQRPAGGCGLAVTDRGRPDPDGHRRAAGSGREFATRRRAAGPFRSSDGCRATFPFPASARRAAPGRPRGRDGRCDRRGGGGARRRSAPRNDVRQPHRERGRIRAARGQRRPCEVPARATVAGRAHAGTDGGRPRGRLEAARRRGGVRVEDGRGAHPGAQVRRHRAHLYAEPQRRRRRHSRDRGAGHGLAGPRADPRWRGNRLQCLAPAAPVPGHHAALGRKLDVERMRAELPIQAFFFDCLHHEGENLADRPARERFRRLAQVLPGSLRMPQRVTASAAEAQAFYEGALAAGHEGVMAKSMDATYQAGNRGATWLKIKRVHTLDLVVIAAEWGHGRRSGKLSNLHLGALDAATGEYVMLGKTFKGLTDAMLAWQTQELLARETHRDGITVHVRPELVVEIAFSDLQASTRYPGGLALRLARVKRYREDKSAGQADTMEVVRRIHASQSVIP